MTKPAKKSPWADVGRYMQLGTLLPACVVAGYAIGYYLDKIFETSFLYLVFLVAGIIGGFIELIREIQRHEGD